ncbi:MAG: YggS family pyridoxal phosphate-dependent enzyme [Betaproteobacteria bacterium]|jgi:pyridoxal phosphate enzyme (YggS family)|nr:YggS family pyridoxal phosphate-dependent enzyme [Betaproteobacteria bacterium]
MTTISTNLQAVRARIAAAAKMAGRIPDDIGLLAVSKTFATERVREAAEAGQSAFGENYVQEGLAKIAALEGLGLEWHFIGPLQSNKTRPVAEHFTWVHGIERLKIAQRLSEARGTTQPPLQVCIQVNVSGEASKSGVSPDSTAELARAVATLPNLQLRGLMAIPEPTEDMALARRRFAMLRELRDALNKEGLALDTLSMGMSLDLEAAILEGATIVRVGTAIFGERA